MDRTALVLIMMLISVLVVAGSLPERFYKANDKLFLNVTIAAAALMAIAFLIYFAAPYF